MENSLIEALSEIIQKEDERYNLSCYHYFISKTNLTECLSKDKNVNIAWKNKELKQLRTICFEFLYEIYQSFPSFLEKMEKQKRDKWFYFLYKKCLQRMPDNYKQQTIDDEIITKPRTIAFKDSKSLWLNYIYNHNIDFLNSRYTEKKFPSDFEEVTEKSCNNIYPVNIDHLILYLRKDDPDFWLETLIIAYNVSKKIEYYWKYKEGYDSDMGIEIWEKARPKLKELIQNDPELKFENGKHFRNYIHAVCRNISRNLLKKIWKESSEDLPIDEYIENLLIDESCELIHDENWLYEIDIEDEAEIEKAVAVILCKESGKLYEKIIEDIEDKVEVLMLRATENLKFKEIVLKQTEFLQLSAKEIEQMATNLRQEVSRTKRALKERVRDLIKNGVKLA